MHYTVLVRQSDLVGSAERFVAAPKGMHDLAVNCREAEMAWPIYQTGERAPEAKAEFADKLNFAGGET